MFIILALIGTLALTTIVAMIARDRGPSLLIGFFVAAVIISTVTAGKLVNAWGYTVSAAILLYSATFLATDTLSEFWGKSVAKKAVIAGLVADILLVYAVQVTILWEPSRFWGHQEALQAILGSTWRIVVASVLAYVLAQTHDILSYDFWKRRTNDRHLWLRNNASTWVSQTIDTVIFYTVAFYGIIPLLPLITVTLVFKIGIAIIDTPFLYIIKWHFGKKNRAEN